MNCFEDLEFRGLIKDMTNNADFKEKLNAGGMTFYIGTDPTADSLHIGHLSSFLICERLARYGHKPIVLVGGATGLVGQKMLQVLAEQELPIDELIVAASENQEVTM